MCICVGFVMCGCVYVGFSNVWVCVCVGFIMCGCCNGWVYIRVCFLMCGYVCMGFVVCGCVYIWILQCVGVYTWAVQKVSDLLSANIQLFILTSETLIPFKVVSLVMHPLLPAVLPLLETFLESFLWNLVQLGHRVLHNVFS